MSLQIKFRDLSDQFDDRSALEKALVALLFIVGPIWVFSSFILAPITTETTSLSRQLSQAQSQLQTLADREQLAIAASSTDPNEPVRVRISRAIDAQSAMDKNIQALAGNLVTPQSMTRLLTSILERQMGLSLISIQNNPPEIVQTAINAAQAPEANSESGEFVSKGRTGQRIFKHSMNVELEGNYLALISYLRRIESFPERFFWDQLSFTQQTWPMARISIQLHTLSAEEGFVGV